MQAELIEAMRWQAEHMMSGMSNQLGEIFPEGTGDTTVKVTGFIFRPATLDDFEGETPDEEDDNLYIFEAHFLAENHELVGNLSSSLMLHFEECDTYEKATAFFIQEVSRQRSSVN